MDLTHIGKCIMNKDSARARSANIIDMAFNFTAMARVLEKGRQDKSHKEHVA
jgi:hypothetical protein